MSNNTIMPNVGAMACRACGSTFTPKRRLQVTCSTACKQTLYRQNRNAERVKTALSGGKCRTGQKSRKAALQVIDNKRNLVTVLGNSETGALRFERVNDVTYKLTDGSKIRTAASHGQWAGRDDDRALGWLMDIGWISGQSAWIVRVGDLSYGPTTLAKAKSAALSIIRGGFDEPVQKVSKPIERLTAMQADMADDARTGGAA